jgi:cation/acetate symporter
MAINQPWLRELLAVSSPVHLWWGIQPVSAAVFGVPLGALTIVVVSLLTRPPRSDSQALVASLRYPDLNLGKA